MTRYTILLHDTRDWCFFLYELDFFVHCTHNILAHKTDCL